MSTIYTAHTATGLGRASGSTQGSPNRLRKYWQAFQAWRIRQALRNRLVDLSDRELQDIGIARGEIEYVVRTAHFTDPGL